MQEPSVSSTTSSPHKLTTIEAEKSAKDADPKTNPNLKDTQENPEETCSNQTPLTESRVSRRSRHRTHTCSKAGRRRSKSSDRRSSRKSRNRRRHRRSRRTRSRSRHYSGSRRQHRRRRRRRYSTESSTFSSSYRSSSESRSPSHRSQHRRHPSDSSQRTDPPNSRSDHESSDAHLKSTSQRNKSMSRDVPQTALSEVPKDNTVLTNGLPKLTATNPALNGLVSLLLNTTNSTNSLTDLFGPALYGIAGNSINPAIPAPSSNSTRQARRLYIGSIPLGITSETMVAFFNAELQTRGLCQSVGEPVVCAQVNSERHFAFIELRSVEETTATLSLDGINCLGSTLRIRRPRDYFPPGTNPSVHPVNHLNANAIFLTGIPTTLSEQSLCRLLSAYGTLRSFSMLRVSLLLFSYPTRSIRICCDSICVWLQSASLIAVLNESLFKCRKSFFCSLDSCSSVKCLVLTFKNRLMWSGALVCSLKFCFYCFCARHA